MQVFAKRRFREYAAQYPTVANELFKIYNDLLAADWEKGADVRAWDPKADYVGHDRWVINVGRNRHRLIARIFSLPSRFMSASSALTLSTMPSPM